MIFLLESSSRRYGWRFVCKQKYVFDFGKFVFSVRETGETFLSDIFSAVKGMQNC
jgi:hypothetical protein